MYWKSTVAFLISFLFAFLAIDVEAATFWTSTSGNGINCVNSATQPSNLATQTSGSIEGGINCLASGDTLYVMQGTYFEGFGSYRHPDDGRCLNTVCVPNGTPGNYTTVSAAPGHERMVTVNSSGNTSLGFGGGPVNWIAVKGISFTPDREFAGPQSSSIAFGSGCYWDPPTGAYHCKMTNSNEPAYPQNLLIENNEFYGCSMSCILGFGHADWYWVGIHNAGGPYPPPPSNSIFRGNDVHDCGSSDKDHCLYVGGTLLIENNRIWHAASFGIQLQGQEWGNYDDVVRGNLIWDSNAGMVVEGCCGPGAPLAGNKVYNNVIYRSGDPTCLPWLDGTNVSCFIGVAGGGMGISVTAGDSHVIANNTFYNLEFGIGIGPDENNVKFFNNVCVNCTANDQGFWCAGGGSSCGPVVGPFVLFMGDFGSNDIQSNNTTASTSALANPSGGNYQLSTGSPLINAGCSTNCAGSFNLTTIFSTDANGVAKGSSWDIGACEWFAGAGQCPTLQASIPTVFPPTVLITSPTTASTYTTTINQLPLSGTVIPNSGTLTSMTCSNSRTPGSKCDVLINIGNWVVFPNITLLPGLNIISVTATNSEGRSSTVVLNATYATSLHVHGTNPRYFADTTGKAILMAGHQIFCDLQDHEYGQPACYNASQPTFDFTNFYIPFINTRGINFVRNWSMFSTGTAGPTQVNTTPMPYVRSTTCCSGDGENKFNLDVFNQAYFDRMAQRASELAKQGKYISISIGGDVFQFDEARWPFNVFKGSNNINGVDADTNADGWGGEFWMSPSAALLARQQAYYAKVIDTLNGFDNVIWETANEPGSVSWQIGIINYVRSYEQNKPKQHPILISWGGLCAPGFSFCNITESEALNSGADAASIGWFDYNDPPINNSGRPLFIDMDHLNGFDNSRANPWKAFTRGYHFTLYDHPFEVPSSEDATWENTRFNIGAIANYANNRFPDLAAMQPSISVSSTGYALSSGTTILVYNPNAGSFTVNMNAGTYNGEWFNPATGAVAGTFTRIVSAAGNQNFIPLSGMTSDAVLYLNTSAPSKNLVAITGPVSTQQYITTVQNYVFNGTASCNTGTPVVTWVNNLGGSGTAAGGTVWSATGTGAALTPHQVNVITVTNTCSDGTATTQQKVAYSPASSLLEMSFDENSGTAPQDVSGNGNHGTFGAGVAYTSTAQKYGVSALDFTGGSVTITSSSLSQQIVGGFSFVAQVNPDTISTTTWRAIAVNNYVEFLYQSTPGVQSCQAGAPMAGFYSNGVLNAVCPTTPLQIGVYSCVAATYDGAFFKMYVNKVEVASVAMSYQFPDSPATGVFEIGSSTFNEDIDAKLDEIRFRPYGMSAAEITTACDTQIGSAPPAPASSLKIGGVPIKIGDKEIKIGF